LNTAPKFPEPSFVHDVWAPSSRRVIVVGRENREFDAGGLFCATFAATSVSFGRWWSLAIFDFKTQNPKEATKRSQQPKPNKARAYLRLRFRSSLGAPCLYTCSLEGHFCCDARGFATQNDSQLHKIRDFDEGEFTERVCKHYRGLKVISDWQHRTPYSPFLLSFDSSRSCIRTPARYFVARPRSRPPAVRIVRWRKVGTPDAFVSNSYKTLARKSTSAAANACRSPQAWLSRGK
jgi:hypothetical protein